MSRIGRLPVAVPSGVQVNVQGSDVHVKGPKGEMKRTFSPHIGIALENGQVVVTRKSDDAAERALHGTTRAVIANMVHGVSSGFQVVLGGGRRRIPRRNGAARTLPCSLVIPTRSKWNLLQVFPLRSISRPARSR